MLVDSKIGSTFLLCLPQYLADHVHFQDCVLRCYKRQTLRMVALDEVHLYTMHGRTFRECIRYLLAEFFKKMYNDSSTLKPPLFLAMTTTMMESILISFSSLTNVDWSKKSHQLWSSFSDFSQQSINMAFDVTSNITQVGIPRLVKHLLCNPDSFAAIYVNFKYECSK